MLSIIRVVLLVAATLAGECGTIGTPCYVEVARTMANRVAAGETNVLSAYYGSAPPTSRSIMVATVLVLRPGLLADGRYYYMDDDVSRQAHGWAEGDLVVYGDRGPCVNFWRRWPGAE